MLPSLYQASLISISIISTSMWFRHALYADFKESKAYSKENLEAQMDHIIRLIKNIKGE